MLRDISSGDCRVEGLDSDNLNSALEGCSESFRDWAEEARGGLYCSRNGRRPPRRQQGRRSLDEKPITIPHSGRSMDALSAKRAGIEYDDSSNAWNVSLPSQKLERRLSLDVRSHSTPIPKFDLPTLPRTSDFELGRTGKVNTCGDEPPLIQISETEADEGGKNDCGLLQSTRNRGSIRKPPLYGSRSRASIDVTSPSRTWESSAFLSSDTSASPRDDEKLLIVPEKRKAELRLVEPSGPNPLELPGPLTPTSDQSGITSGQAEAFLLKYTGDLKVSFRPMLQAECGALLLWCIANR